MKKYIYRVNEAGYLVARLVYTIPFNKSGK